VASGQLAAWCVTFDNIRLSIFYIVELGASTNELQRIVPYASLNGATVRFSCQLAQAGGRVGSVGLCHKHMGPGNRTKLNVQESHDMSCHFKENWEQIAARTYILKHFCRVLGVPADWLEEL
jgi:hypothetical protein